MPRSRTSELAAIVLKRGLLTALLWAMFALPGAAQEAPTVRGLLSGYGAVGYAGTSGDEFDSDFTAFVAPVTVFQVGDDLLFESEIELKLEGTATTEVNLEHAQVHYLGFEHFQFTAGMAHMPFGFWKHSNWVNKLPTEPLLFEDTHGFPAQNNLMPIFFDVGAKGEANFELREGWMGTVSAWVSQGPAPVEEGAGHGHGGHGHGGEGHEAAPASSVPDLGYGGNFLDNNSDKMVGVRLRGVSMGGLILQGSGFRAKYDDAGELAIRGLNGALVWAPGPWLDFRVEGTILDQEFLGEDGVESVDYGGYYLQLSRRFGDFEPVVRWGQLPRTVAGGGVLLEKRRQLVLGLNYILSPSVPIKVAYNVEADRDDSFFIEWAVGF